MENKKIVVFGSYVTDLTGRTPKFPTEGETVMGVSFKSGPGKLALIFYDKEGIDS